MNIELTKITQTKYAIFIIDNLLTEEECDELKATLDDLARSKRYYQTIEPMPNLSDSIWQLIKDKLPKEIHRNGDIYRLHSLSDQVTLSRHRSKHIGIHKDNDVKIKGENLYCLYKLAIYLNDLSDPHNPKDTTGGTYFYCCRNHKQRNRHKRFLYKAKPSVGRGVLFDMREYHSGAQIPPGKTKYMIGVRPVYEKLKKAEN